MQLSSFVVLCLVVALCVITAYAAPEAERQHDSVTPIASK